MSWKIVYTKTAQKDAKKLAESDLKENTQKLLRIIQKDPFIKKPPYKKLVGDLKGAYSRRINLKHRLVYQIFKEEKLIKVIRMWSHYE